MSPRGEVMLMMDLQDVQSGAGRQHGVVGGASAEPVALRRLQH